MKSGRIKRHNYKLWCNFIVLSFMVALTGFATVVEAVYELPAERIVTWQGNVGVEGGIPTRTTERNCVTLSGIVGDGVTDDAAAIQDCIDNKTSAGETAYLPAGTYVLGSTLRLRANKTLRGAGRDSTILLFNTVLTNDVMAYGHPTKYTNAPITIKSGYTKGSVTLVLADASSLSPGDFVYITELNDPTLPVSIVGTGGTCTYCGIYGADGTRARLQIAKITNVVSNTITINPPLYFTLSAANSPKVNKTPVYIQYAGIENLTVKNGGTTNGYRRNIYFQGVANSWVKNVKVDNCGKMCIGLDLDNFRNEIRDNYITNCIDRFNSGTCYGVNINAGSANLVENNTFSNMTASAVVLRSSSGNVIGYNYAYSMHRTINSTGWFWNDFWTHGAHNTFNLFEGNEGQGLSFDIIHGSGSHNTAFRNRWLAKDLSVTYDQGVQNVAAITTANKNNYMNLIGNILGTSGWNDTYEEKLSAYWTTKPIYATGSFGGNIKQFNTTLRHMNYDYVTNTVKYCSDAGEPGCQGGDQGTTLPASLYLTSKPAFFRNLPWPAIGPDLSPMDGTIPAKERFYAPPPVQNLRVLK